MYVAGPRMILAPLPRIQTVREIELHTAHGTDSLTLFVRTRAFDIIGRARRGRTHLRGVLSRLIEAIQSRTGAYKADVLLRVGHQVCEPRASSSRISAGSVFPRRLETVRAQHDDRIKASTDKRTAGRQGQRVRRGSCRTPPTVACILELRLELGLEPPGRVLDDRRAVENRLPTHAGV